MQICILSVILPTVSGNKTVLSIYLLILPTPSRAFLAGTARQGYEKE